MLRTVLVILFIAIFLILSLPLLLIEWLISLFKPRFVKRRTVLKWIQFGFRSVAFLSGVKKAIIGKEHIPADEAVLFIGNHQSYFDIVVAYGIAPSFIGFLSKKEMGRYPVIASLMKYCNCLFLDRNDIRQGMETIKKAIELINEGVSVFIYPEGTRNHNPDEFMEFAKGSFKIAQRTNCPIVPVATVGSRDILENHFPKIKSGKVVLEYLTPFRFSDLTHEQQKNINTYTAGLIKEVYEKNKASG